MTFDRKEYQKNYYQENKDRIRILDNARKLKWYHQNKEKLKVNPLHYDRIFNAHLKSNYNISTNDYKTLLMIQNYKCAICDNKCTTGRRLSVDHDHSTGEIRGLLCMNCNLAIGKFKDNTTLLNKAIKYLNGDL